MESGHSAWRDDAATLRSTGLGQAAGHADLFDDCDSLASAHEAGEVGVERMKRHPAIGIGAPPDSPRAVSVMSSSLRRVWRRRRTARRSPHVIKAPACRVLPLSARYCCIIGVWAMLGRCVGWTGD